ncbi:hypothetical protein [Streptomyces sp. NPDC005407]|uniref:hypothetical protein n=1 Tax=Streptomyces sp. NPDC005407 TaxID=3155340 RepID=UPI0033B65CB0
MASQVALLLTALRDLGAESGVPTLRSRFRAEMDVLDPGVFEAVRDADPALAREALLEQHPATALDPDLPELTGACAL